MPGRLDKYRSMRDFSKTPEPSGKIPRRRPKAPRFVVQEHHATALHWDFRLERGGVLVSWAVPKGIPPDPKVNGLAVHTEDHPLSYIDFEGHIPEGEYGGGKVILWDTGTYEEHKFLEDEVIVTLHGSRVSGKYVLFQTNGKNWMIHRMDPPADPAREPMPTSVAPMFARLHEGIPAREGDYGYEIKWDGVRTIAYSQGGRLRLQSRTLLETTGQYPELRELGASLGAREVILDGEIVAIDEELGRASFERLQNRMNLTSESIIRRRMREIPVTYVIFDLLFLDGHSTLTLPYEDRRNLLEKLKLRGPYWQTPGYHRGDGHALRDASKAQGLEGIVAKRLDSQYEPGRRSGAWLKIKNHAGQELIIAGYTRGEGNRSGSIGALLTGHFDITAAEAARLRRPQKLNYSGKVGTGYTEKMLADLQRRFAPLERHASPYDAGSPPKGATFLEPRLVGQFEFSEWTRAGIIRQPVFKGLRTDRDPQEVTREVPGRA